MAVEAFTLIATLKAIDEASEIIDRIVDAFDSLGGAADKAAEAASESGSIIDESLLKTASGADAVTLANDRMAASNSKLTEALGAQAAAEKDLMAARASGMSDAEMAAMVDKLAEAEKAATIATNELEASTARYASTIDAAIAAERRQVETMDTGAGAAATYSAALDKAWGAAKIGTAIVAAVGYESVKTASKFQASMTMIRTQANDTTDNINQMGQAVIALAPKVGMTPDELAQGLYHIASAGIRGSQALDILKISAEGATIGNANLEDVTQAMIAANRSGIKGVQNMTQAMGAMNAIVGTGDMRMENLAQAFSTGILPAAKVAGLSLTDVGAALATLTDNAVKPVEAATRLKTSLSMLSAPSAQAQKAFESIGLKGLQLANDMRQPNGLLVALEDLKKHLSEPVSGSAFQGSITTAMTELQNLGMSSTQAGDEIKKVGVGGGLAIAQLAKFGLTIKQAETAMTKLGPNATEQAALLAKAFGGGRSSATILTLLEEMDTLKSKYPAITQGAKGFGEDWTKTTQTAVFQSKSIKASIDAIGVSLGTALLPMVQKFLGIVINLLGPIVQWTSAHSKLAATILVVVGAIGMFVGYLKLAMGIAKGFTAVMALLDVEMDANPIGILIAAIGLLVVGLIYCWNHFAGFRDFMKAAWADIKMVVSMYIDALKTEFKLVVDAAMLMWRGMQDAWNGITTAAKAVWNALVTAWDTIASVTTTVWDHIASFFEKWWPLLLVIFATPIAVLIAAWNHFHKDAEDAAKETWTKIKNFFVDTWHLIEDAAKIAWKLIQSYIVDPVKAVWNFIQPAVHKVTSFLSGQWNDIKSEARAAWNLFYTYIVSPLEKANDKVSQILTKVKNVVLSDLRKTVDQVKSIGSWFVQIGDDIVNGIVKGVTEGGGKLFSSLKNLASGALSAAKSFLGIGSPSKKFAEDVGQWIPAGIGAGVTSNAATAHNAVSNLVKSLPGVSLQGSSHLTITGTTKLTGTGITAGATGSLGTGTAGGGVYIDMRGSQLMSDKDYDTLAQKLGRRIATQILPQGGVRIRM